MKRLLIIACLIACAASANAQETRDTFALNPLVVSVTRSPIERAAASAAVSVLSGAELRARGLRTIADALRSVAGATVSQSGAYGAFGSLFLRGGESDYVQVLIDGVQVNSPGEHFDFGSLTLEDVDRVEVVRGPVSVLYGSDAVSGVVQVFTRSGRGPASYRVSANAGMGSRVADSGGDRHVTQAFDAQAGGGNARASYSVGGTLFHSDGVYPFNSSNGNGGITGRMALAPDAATSLSATVRYNRNDLHYPTDGAGNLVDNNQRDITHAIAAGVEIARTWSARLETRALLSLDRNTDRYDDAPDTPGDTLGFYASFSDERFQREAVDLRLNYLLSRKWTFTVGGAYEDQHERGSNTSESQYGPFSGSSNDSRSNRAVYGQLLAAVARVHVQAGARLDHNSRFGTFATYRGGLSAHLLDHLLLRASAGTSFKQPRFYEQFATGFTTGNPDLEPEQSQSVDGGLEYLAGHWRLSSTLFGQRFHNLIQYVGSPAPGQPSYTNLGAARARGLELEAEHALGPVLLRGSYTLLESQVVDAGNAEDPLFVAGQTLLRRPRQSGALSLAYARLVWQVALSANYVGKRDDIDFNNYPNRVTLRSYTRVDASADRQIAPPLRATLRIENLLNAGYEEIFNFPARGRMVFLGVRLEK